MLERITAYDYEDARDKAFRLTDELNQAHNNQISDQQPDSVAAGNEGHPVQSSPPNDSDKETKT